MSDIRVPCGRARAAQRGFTLVEMAVVLVVIGLILGAVAIGRDLQRNAVYQRLGSDFVQGWQVAYDAYVVATGAVPGDSASAPTGRVNGASISGGVAPELCGSDLLNAFLAAGVALPEGRTEGQSDRYVYLDSNGLPQEAQVCFQSVDWADPGSAVGSYVLRPRNVMSIKRLTPALANMLDAQIDGKSDARFGRFRETSQAGQNTVTTSVPWSADETMAYGSTTSTALDESQVAVVNAYFLMNR